MHVLWVFNFIIFTISKNTFSKCSTVTYFHLKNLNLSSNVTSIQQLQKQWHVNTVFTALSIWFEFKFECTIVEGIYSSSCFGQYTRGNSCGATLIQIARFLITFGVWVYMITIWRKKHNKCGIWQEWPSKSSPCVHSWARTSVITGMRLVLASSTSLSQTKEKRG